MMTSSDARLVTLDDIKVACELLPKCQYVCRTPMMHSALKHTDVGSNVDLHLKLENLQVTGSFKTRGVAYQMLTLPEESRSAKQPLISMSAGNYGKAYAIIAKDLGLEAKLLMPITAPENRRLLIESYGVKVQAVPTSELLETVKTQVSKENMLFLHPFDDLNLISGYGSVGIEILEDVPQPDVVVVCCGGGGILSGVAAAIKLSGHDNCRIYGVEPENSRVMHESLRTGKPATMEVKSVAAGLSPPFAGTNTFRHCKEFVEDILLVSDEEIVKAVFYLYEQRILAEPSGAAAFAALLFDKIPDVQGKRVVIVITGGNVSPQELIQISKDFDGPLH